MRVKTVVLSLVVLVLCSTSLYAKTLSLGLKASTLGAGPEVEVSFLDFLGVRGGLNYWKYNYDGTKDDIDYKFKLKLNSVPVFLDIHPFKGSFRLTGGVLINRNKLDANAEIATGTKYEIGDQKFDGSEIGKLKGKITFNDTAPYAGLGWDTSFGRDKAWGFIMDLGVVFSGSPKVDLSASGGTKSNDPTFLSELAKEEDNMQDDLNAYKYYPVIGIGVNYRF